MLNSLEGGHERHCLSLRAVLPGLLLILIVDLITISGFWPNLGWVNSGLFLFMACVPWATLLILRKPIACLGYSRAQLLRSFGWGMVVGGIWRVFSLSFNLWWTNLGDRPIQWAPLIGALIWVPLVEETFFRGYLGRALSGKFRPWPGILIQAALFTLHPVHWSQGALSLMSVLGFGVIAGWLQLRFNNIWSAWGAHAFANVLPHLLNFV
jgi:membrane protease YdiL (CAAX protease family)